MFLKKNLLLALYNNNNPMFGYFVSLIFLIIVSKVNYFIINFFLTIIIQ